MTKYAPLPIIVNRAADGSPHYNIAVCLRLFSPLHLFDGGSDIYASKVPAAERYRPGFLPIENTRDRGIRCRLIGFGLFVFELFLEVGTLNRFENVEKPDWEVRNFIKKIAVLAITRGFTYTTTIFACTVFRDKKPMFYYKL